MRPAAPMAPDLVAALDEAGACAVLLVGDTVRAATRAAASLLGRLSPADLVGLPLSEFSLAVGVRRSDGTLVACQRWNHPLPDGALLVLFQEAPLSDALLVESEARHRAIFEGATDGIFLADDRCFYVDANEAGCRLLGLERTALRGRQLAEFMLEQPSPQEGRNLTPGHTLRSRRQVRRSDGAIVPVEVSSSVLPGGLSQCVVRDLTEQLRTEEALRQATKLDAIGSLSAGVAHDFNNLLAVFQSLAEELHRLLPSAAVASVLDELQQTIDKGAGLTRQILAFARRASATPRSIDLVAALTSFATFLERTLGEDIRLVIAPAERPAWVHLDPVHFDQILLNLGVNARDAMPRGGVLSFAVSASDSEVTLTVADSGHGIDEAALEHIFEPFFTTKKPGHGTGLGLATVHGIVSSAGGSVSVESCVGLGTTFQLKFPSAVPAAVLHRSPPVSACNPQRLMVLLVEDDAQVRLALHRTLVSLGHEVVPAGDAAEALALLQAGPHIGLVVTDLVLPHLGGDDMARKMGAIRPGLPIVFVTGYEPGACLRELGQVVTKPFSASALQAAIEKEVERRLPDELDRTGATSSTLSPLKDPP